MSFEELLTESRKKAEEGNFVSRSFVYNGAIEEYLKKKIRENSTDTIGRKE